MNAATLKAYTSAIDTLGEIRWNTRNAHGVLVDVNENWIDCPKMRDASIADMTRKIEEIKAASVEWDVKCPYNWREGMTAAENVLRMCELAELHINKIVSEFKEIDEAHQAFHARPLNFWADQATASLW